jgi:protein-S-isoprenylcysteine O-methyltransferase Ste14
MKALELKIPPAAVAFVTAGSMWGVRAAWPALTLDVPGRKALGVALAVAGGAAGLVAIADFRRARTTVNPTRPDAASSLVTTGVYARSRNPMYAGLLGVLAGWGVALGHPAALLALPGFVAYMNRFQIQPEERALRARFGEAFEAYAAEVRRWA